MGRGENSLLRVTAGSELRLGREKERNESAKKTDGMRACNKKQNNKQHILNEKIVLIYHFAIVDAGCDVSGTKYQEGDTGYVECPVARTCIQTCCKLFKELCRPLTTRATADLYIHHFSAKKNGFQKNDGERPLPRNHIFLSNGIFSYFCSIFDWFVYVCVVLRYGLERPVIIRI